MSKTPGHAQETKLATPVHSTKLVIRAGDTKVEFDEKSAAGDQVYIAGGLYGHLSVSQSYALLCCLKDLHEHIAEQGQSLGEEFMNNARNGTDRLVADLVARGGGA